ncbi:MAG: Ig domain-containing protein [Gemmatimonadetes bacterium]|nr:Ig domain-containing protein [Gemmatimonadota bacterium]MBA4159240.1 Ig domain-containing protein [Gemmatimonadota bacterium]
MTTDGIEDVNASKAKASKSITISPKEAQLTALDETVRLTATVVNGGGKLVSDPNVKWVSLNPEVATVNSTGLVTAVGVGTAQITGSAQGGTDTATVTVEQVIDYIGVSPGYAFLEKLETQQLTALAWDANKNNVPTASFTWSSDNEAVATVDPAGLVTAVGDGQAEITATAVNSSKSASSIIAVGKKQDPPPPPSEWNRVLADTTVIGDVVVPDGEAWLIGQNVKVQGNVRTVNGIVALRPGSTLTFVGGDPTRYVGGGMHYNDSFANDFGLWIGGMGAAGRLDIACSPKTSWNRTGSDPTWKSGDEYWIAPTAVGDYKPRRWSPGNPIPHVDPRVPTAEVANVTRDCQIVGAPTGHIHIHSTSPQRIEYVRLQGLGIFNQGFPDYGAQTGRYVIHLHMMGEGARGTVIRGVAAVDSRGRVFVPHASHGVHLEDNVSLNGFVEGLWWDRDVAADRTNDITVDRLLVMGTETPRAISGRTHTWDAVTLVGGERNTITNSAVAGNRGHGFHWPSRGDNFGPAIWTFEGNVGHNNELTAIRFWFNSSRVHNTVRSWTYHNKDSGIENGAYANSHRFADIVSLDRMAQHSSSKIAGDGGGARFERIEVYAPAGPALQIGRLRLPAQNRTEFIDCTLQAGPGAPKVVFDARADNPPLLLFRRCGLVPTDIVLPDPLPETFEGTSILIEHEDNRLWEITVTNGSSVVTQLR